jgi:hypothetical protein
MSTVRLTRMTSTHVLEGSITLVFGDKRCVYAPDCVVCLEEQGRLVTIQTWDEEARFRGALAVA